MKVGPFINTLEKGQKGESRVSILLTTHYIPLLSFGSSSYKYTLYALFLEKLLSLVFFTLYILYK